MAEDASHLASLTLLDESGSPRRLGDLWAERPVALVFLRHFGWLFCRELTVQLHQRKADFLARGADIVLIGSGAPFFIAPFREDVGFTGLILSDPELVAFEAAGMVRSLRAAMNPLALARAVRAMSRGHFQGRTKGDALQQGGALIVAPGDRVLYAYHSPSAGAHPDLEAMLASLERADAA